MPKMRMCFNPRAEGTILSKRIVHCTSVHNWDDVRIFHKMAVSAAQTGHDVHIVALADQSSDFEQSGVHVHLVSRVKSSRISRSTSGARSVIRRANELTPDFLHFHDPELLPWAVFNKGQAALIYDVHEDLPRQVSTKAWIPGLLRPGIAAICEVAETTFARGVDHFVCATDTISMRFGERATTVRNLPVASSIQPGTTPLSDRANAFAYVGGISALRGFNSMLTAHSLLNATGGVETELHLAGKFNETHLRDIDTTAYGSRIFLHGSLGRDGVNEILSQALCGLCVLLPTSNYVDALPVKMFEYMAAGIPVIASDFPLWRGILEAEGDRPCGICVNPESPSEIAEAMRTISTDRNLAQTMGLNGRARIDQGLNWRTEQSRLLDIYAA